MKKVKAIESKLSTELTNKEKMIINNIRAL